jgi:hypothetical protein
MGLIMEADVRCGENLGELMDIMEEMIGIPETRKLYFEVFEENGKRVVFEKLRYRYIRYYSDLGY